jgi:hypothetical protein
LNITGITINDRNFSETNNCGTEVGAGKSCTITVGWRPHFAFGSRLSISDDGGGSPQTVPLSGYEECTP